MTSSLAFFDLDGTLADLSHRVHHAHNKDWREFFANVHNDTPIYPIVRVAQALYMDGHRVVIVSGRSDECEAATIQWLVKHNIPYSAMFMRRAGDHRPDNIVKLEMYHKRILPMFGKPDIIFDDRQQVVDMWRAEGLVCVQVAPGNF